MSKHYEGVKHEPKGNERPGIPHPRFDMMPEGKRLPMRYEGTEIGYAIILEGGRTANITITSEKHAAELAPTLQDIYISNREDRSIT